MALRFLKVLTDAGIIPGIKVDAGAKDLAGHPGEKITEGLESRKSSWTGITLLEQCRAATRKSCEPFSTN